MTWSSWQSQYQRYWNPMAQSERAFLSDITISCTQRAKKNTWNSKVAVKWTQYLSMQMHIQYIGKIEYKILLKCTSSAGIDTEILRKNQRCNTQSGCSITARMSAWPPPTCCNWSAAIEQTSQDVCGTYMQLDKQRSRQLKNKEAAVLDTQPTIRQDGLTQTAELKARTPLQFCTKNNQIKPNRHKL